MLNRMKIEADKILEKLRKKERKGRTVTMYLDSGVWKDFQDACKPVTASHVVEELLRQFLDSKKKKG